MIILKGTPKYLHNFDSREPGGPPAPAPQHMWLQALDDHTALHAHPLPGAALVGAGSLALVIPCSAVLAKWNERVRGRHMVVSDARVKLCAEVLRSIKVVKTCAPPLLLQSTPPPPDLMCVLC